MIEINGYQKLTLLDFPGKLAATVFLGRCNFRCPFCHNSELFSPADVFPEEDVLEMIKKRAAVIEGVAITGGEPTLSPGLPEFMRKIKDMGLLVKLDSNGYRPEILRQIIDEGLADYIAMDIKSGHSGYALAAGVPNIDMSRIDESVNLLMEGHVSFEFRTTVVPELHSEEDFEEIAEWIAGDEPYFLQGYRDSEMVYNRKFSQPTPELMEHIRQLVLPKVSNTSIRGVE